MILTCLDKKKIQKQNIILMCFKLKKLLQKQPYRITKHIIINITHSRTRHLRICIDTAFNPENVCASTNDIVILYLTNREP